MERVRTLKRRPGLFLAAIRAGDLVIDMLMGAFVATWRGSPQTVAQLPPAVVCPL
jgi:hypothetical protein